MANRNDSKSRPQVVTPRARRIPNARSQPGKKIKFAEIAGALSAFVKPISVVLAIVLLIFGYNVLAGSRAFQLQRVVVVDAAPSLRAEVEQAVRRGVGQAGLLEVDLAAVRKNVESLPRVRAATIARMLPDGIFVGVVERQPVVLVRRESGPREGKLVWLDDDAVEMGEFSELKREMGGDSQDIPPVAKGFAEGLRSQAMVAEDRDRVALYKQMQREFSQGAVPLWGIIDQIDLTFPRDVNLHLAHPPVIIHVGSVDLRNRFERALEVLQAAQQGDTERLRSYRIPDFARLIQNAAYISFVDASRSERIVVNFATPGAQKTTKQERKQE